MIFAEIYFCAGFPTPKLKSLLEGISTKLAFCQGTFEIRLRMIRAVNSNSKLHVLQQIY